MSCQLIWHWTAEKSSHQFFNHSSLEQCLYSSQEDMISLSSLESSTEKQDSSEHNTLEIICNSDMNNSEYSWWVISISHLDDHALEDFSESHTVNLLIEYEDSFMNRESCMSVTLIVNSCLTDDCKCKHTNNINTKKMLHY